MVSATLEAQPKRRYSGMARGRFQHLLHLPRPVPVRMHQRPVQRCRDASSEACFELALNLRAVFAAAVASVAGAVLRNPLRPEFCICLA